MSEPTPERVRITGPPRRRSSAIASRRTQIDQETRLGAIYMGSLLREQFKLAIRTLLVLIAGVVSLPLLFHLFPHLSTVRLLGIPLSWLLIGVAVYPFLVLLGWWYVRAAERNERDFIDLVESDT